VRVAETGERYLLLRGYRHQIAKGDALAVELALRATPAVAVSEAVLQVVPAGKPIAPIAVPELGKPSRAVAGRPELRSGQLAVVTTSRGAQHFLVEPTRLRPITELQYDLQRGFASTAAAYADKKPVGVQVGMIEAGSAAQTETPAAVAGDAPTTRPEFVETGAAASVCLTFEPGDPVPRFALDPAMPDTDPMMATPRRTNGGVTLADRVVVSAGRAAVVEAMPNDESPAGTMLLVTDMGVAYPLGDRAVLGVLGYDDVRPVKLPAALVSRVPMGSGLSHGAALSR